VKLFKNFIFFIALVYALISPTMAQLLPDDNLPAVLNLSSHSGFIGLYDQAPVVNTADCNQCAIGCSINVNNHLSNLIKEYHTLCNFDAEPAVIRQYLFGFLLYLARLEGYNTRASENLKTSLLDYNNASNRALFPLSLGRLTAFISYVTDPNGVFDIATRNLLWDAVEDDLTNYYSAKPSFFVKNLLAYVRVLRQHNINLSYLGPGDTECIGFSKYLVVKLTYLLERPLDQIEELWYSEYNNCGSFYTHTITDNAIDRGGWVASWWIYENKDNFPQVAPQSGLQIFSGYVLNNQVFSIRAYRSTDGAQAGYQVQFGSTTEQVTSGATCDSLVFATLAIFKDCATYKLWFSLRWHITNTVYVFGKTDPAQTLTAYLPNVPLLPETDVSGALLSWTLPSEIPFVLSNTPFTLELQETGSYSSTW
jgi:hypothetical protein